MQCILAIFSVFIGSFNFTFNHIIPICHFLQIDTIHSYHYTSTFKYLWGQCEDADTTLYLHYYIFIIYVHTCHLWKLKNKDRNVSYHAQGHRCDMDTFWCELKTVSLDFKHGHV